VISSGTPPTGALRELTVEGGRLAVREWGEPGGRPLLFWHPLGTVTSGAWLTELAPVLVRHGYRAVAVDGPGFGASPAIDPGQMGVDRLAGLMWGVAAALGLHQPVVMGHSWGGVVALRAAAERAADVAALVLLDSGHRDYADDPRTQPDLTLADRAGQVRDQLEVWPDLAALHADVQDDLRRPATDALLAALAPAVRQRDHGSLVPVVSAETVAGARHGLVRERCSARWPALADAGTPVLLLLADQPPELAAVGVADAERMRASLPQLEARLMTGWGHDLIGDGGPAVAEVVVEWLSDVRP
jgi:pimeloyl-ACP methyl ester carboxylesterase